MKQKKARKKMKFVLSMRYVEKNPTFNFHSKGYWYVELAFEIRHNWKSLPLTGWVKITKKGIEFLSIHPVNFFDKMKEEKIQRIHHEIITSDLVQEIREEIKEREQYVSPPVLNDVQYIKRDKTGKLTFHFNLPGKPGYFVFHIRYSKRKKMFKQYGLFPKDGAEEVSFRTVSDFEELVLRSLLNEHSVQKVLANEKS